VCTELDHVDGEGGDECLRVDGLKVQKVHHDTTHVGRTAHGGGGEIVVPAEESSADVVRGWSVAPILRRVVQGGHVAATGGGVAHGHECITSVAPLKSSWHAAHRTTEVIAGRADEW
jgi:hypothetical protein